MSEKEIIANINFQNVNLNYEKQTREIITNEFEIK